VKITLLCSDPEHPVNTYLLTWARTQPRTHEVELVQKKAQLTGGDFLFLVSCSEIIGADDRARYKATLVLHASDLPKGRGWSPHIWELINGADHITLSLLEAEDKVDSGKIWKKTRIGIPKDALWDEINHLLFSAEIQLIDFVVKHFDQVRPESQDDTENPSYFPKRSSEDSRIDPTKSIAAQFDLIRVCDPNRFPAYFEHLGHRYTLRLEKFNEH
jgi:methionyl-tRNA formyltransferase